MASAAVAYDNLADDGSVSASGQRLLMPAANVLTPHVEQRWRSVTNTAWLIADLGSAQSIDTVMLRGLTVGSGSTGRVRISATDPSVETGELYNSGSFASGSVSFDADYGAIVDLLDEAVSGRYVRIDIADPDGTYIEAGRLFVGTRTQFTRNFIYGWSVGWVDRSTSQKSRGGQTLIWPDNKHRTLDVSFDALSSAERYGTVETIDRVNGKRTDILFITDPDSTNLARDSIWGLVTDLTPVAQPQFVDIFGKQYRIEERL